MRIVVDLAFSFPKQRIYSTSRGRTITLLSSHAMVTERLAGLSDCVTEQAPRDLCQLTRFKAALRMCDDVNCSFAEGPVWT